MMSSKNFSNKDEPEIEVALPKATKIKYDELTNVEESDEKKVYKILNHSFLVYPWLATILANVVLIFLLSAIGFGLGMLFSINASKEYGDHCIKDSDCSRGKHLVCSKGFCDCMASKYFFKSYTEGCVLKQLPQATCSQDSQCCCDQFCISNKCQCKSQYFFDVSTNKCKLLTWQGKPCYDSTECATNMICLSNTCQCTNDTYWSGVKCEYLKTYLDVCRLTSSCNKWKNLYCDVNSGSCLCQQTNQYWDINYLSCRTQSSYGGFCNSTSLNACPSNLGLSCSTNQCICSANYYWSSISNMCVKKASNKEYCSASIPCDNTLQLNCASWYCTCPTNQFWNGTCCVPYLTYGLSCKNSYVCDSTKTLVCSPSLKQCVCDNKYYWSSSASNCLLQTANGTSCSYTVQCQTYNGLSCQSNLCLCASTYYWSLVSLTCLPKQTVNTLCTYTYQCQDYLGLSCLQNGVSSEYDCECSYNQYWNGAMCVNKLTYNSACSSSSECNNVVGLVCYIYCRCNQKYYWDGSTCALKKVNGSSCSKSVECQDYLGLLCISSVCQCHQVMYYDGTQCSFKITHGAACTSTNLCRDYAGLSCQSNVCSCRSNQYWVNNKCQNPVGINQFCDNIVYFCAPTLQCQDSANGNKRVCECPSTTYWKGSSCVPLQTYGSVCSWDNPCDFSLGLICSLPGSVGIQCKCPYDMAAAMCDCPLTKYWNGATCVNRVGLNQPCNNDYECTYNTGLFCYTRNGGGTCQCNGFYSHFWDTATSACKACSNSFANYYLGYSGSYDPYNCVAIPIVLGTYASTCSATQLCDTSLFLTCSTGSGTGCNCPYTLGGGVCDCPTTMYWDGSKCVTRSSLNEGCSNDYECKYNSGLICYTISGSGTCQCPFYTSKWVSATSSCTACSAKYSANTYYGNSNNYDPYTCTYITYGSTCSSTISCPTSQGLICSTGTNCNCPQSLGTNFCDCPTTHYWDSANEICVPRGWLEDACTLNYHCAYGTNLYCHATSNTCSCPDNSYWSVTDLVCKPCLTNFYQMLYFTTTVTNNPYKCYYLHTATANYFPSKYACQALDSSTSLMLDSFMTVPNLVYKWGDGTVVSLSYFNTNQPDHIATLSEDVIESRSSYGGKLNDIPNTAFGSYVCQYGNQVFS